MKNPYNQAGLTGRLRQLGLAALLVGSASAAQAQALPYSAANVVKSIGTYADISGVVGSTVIATANTDDANSAAQTIPFAFTYNGTAYSQFVLNTNGFIKMGPIAPTGPSYNDGALSNAGGPPTGADNNLIMPFNNDLTAGTGGTEYRMAVSGTSPNRVLTIQWKNVSDKARAMTASSAAVGVQYANISFQVKLYEAGSRIDFVYDTATPGPGPDNPKFTNVGIKGSGSGANQLILGVKSSSTPWANTTFTSGPYTGNCHNVRSTVLPESGRTYSFTIPVPQDASVQVVYGFDKLLVPGGQPATIRANVRNAGTGALGATTVTLNVTGANTATATQTVPSLAVGASAVVSFTNVMVPTPGNNTVTVSVGNDGNNANNSASLAMVTNSSTTSYITPGTPPSSAFGFGAGSSDLFFGAKVTITQPQDLIAVNAFLFNDVNAVGSSAYGVAVDATSGALLARSPDFVITAASLNTLHTFTFSSPPTVPTGDVIVGMATVAATGAVQFFLMGVQSEIPTRPNTFYSGSAVTPAAPSPSLTTPATAIYKYMLEAVFAAPATCATPNTIAVSNVTQTGAQVSFVGPNNGTGYQVVYVPTGTTPTATSPFVTGTTSPITILNGTLTAGTGYDIYVRALCGATDRSGLAGPTFFSTPCAPPVINTFPYPQNFDVIANGQDLPCGVTVSDINADGSKWEPLNSVTSGVTQIPVTRSQPYAMVYVTNADGITAADDWFYLPAMRFVRNAMYRVSFWYRNNSRPGLLDESLEVKYGLGATPAGQTTLLYSNSAIATGPVVMGGSQSYTLADKNSTPAVADIAPAATGLYYIGFHANSPADRGFLAVDDITVIGVLATSEALSRAISVYPNPSNTGSFKLDIAGANAKGSLQVEVSNMLGQRVYTSTAKDNFSNELNLSNLAAGIYSLKVKNGTEYMQQQISIVK